MSTKDDKLIIGLTGGIGSGKTTVANLFAELGAEIIDTDLLAREVVKPGTVGLKAIVARYGKAILNEQDQLDRQQLKQIVFNNLQERQWLEQLLHPKIRELMLKAILKSNKPYYICVIPLLIEAANPNPLIQRVLVVDAPQAVRIERTQQRDNLDIATIEKIIAAQATDEQRQQAADDIITNDSDINSLKQQVKNLHETYLKAST